MKTPDIKTLDWHLDNYIGKTVKVQYENEKLNFEGTFLDETARGLFIRMHINSKSTEVWYLPAGTYKNLALPELIKPENKQHEDVK